MSVITIWGGYPLEGGCLIHGAKNSVLPILAAALLSNGTCIIRNCPRLTDVDHTLAILESLGCRICRAGDTVTVDAADPTGGLVPDELMGRMRSSVLFLGPMLGRLGRARLTYPGGCELGPRPIDLHLDAIRQLGGEVSEEGGHITCQGHLTGTDITLSLPSVGATENIMLAAVTACGETTINNAAREPEIADLQGFLNAMGAEIRGAGSSVITILGGKQLHGGEYTVMADRIVAATYLSAAAAAGGEVELTGVDWRHLAPVTAVLAQAGCTISSGEKMVHLKAPPRLRAVRPIRTAPYPGFPTDAQAVVMAALTKAEGVTLFTENMFDSRYRHVGELTRMGAEICTEGRVAAVYGVDRLRGASVTAADLRGGAALLVAGLAAEGITRVGGLEHIDRGYASPVEDLTGLSARLERTS